MAEEYEVPKRETPARVLLPDGSRRELRLYLSDRAERHAGRERPSDLLNGDEPFVPVRFADADFALLRRSSILAMTVEVEEERIDPADSDELFLPGDGAGGVERREVRVVLADGSDVTGTMTYVMPPGERRLQDYLNRAPEFVRLLDGDRVVLVNSGRIVRVEPL